MTTEQLFGYAVWAGLVIGLILLAAGYKIWLRLLGIVIIPGDSLGVVTKKFVIFGSNRTLPPGAVVATKGEAGLQAETLEPGLHYWLWPWQYAIDVTKFTVVADGTLGVVTARDGQPLANGRVLARRVDCETFQNARGFLEAGGERGPQIAIMPPGVYRINTGLFTVRQAPVMDIKNNMVGVVTTTDGAPLAAGEIAGRPVAGHNSYQDGQTFIDKGGMRGRQEHVLLAGRYYLNPYFVAVEQFELTSVPIAQVGVVIAYVGDEGHDVTGNTFRHGNLVPRGQKGVWVDPLDPGKYPINPYTHKVEMVPTANVVLNWATGKSEAHKLDQNLSTITVRSSDGFTFNLDVSQIIHIPRNDAPKVIARFGSMANLVTQVLEPTIGNYFRNAAQSSDVIDFLRQRQERQAEARGSITAALTQYNVGAVDTLIGDITPPPELMKTLTDRKLAEQEKTTYQTQELAENTRKALEQARAMATTQAQVVAAERAVEIARFNAQSAIERAEGEAKAKTTNAAADAEVTRVTGDADAAKVLAIGEAEAKVIQQKIESMESGNFAGIEIAKALASSNVPLVPEVMAGGGGADGGSMVALLLAGLVRETMQNGKRTEPHS